MFDQIPDHWEFTTLGVVCHRGGGTIQTGPFGSQLHASDYVPVGVPSIMPINIGDIGIRHEGIARVGIEDAERLVKHRVRTGDIVYSRRGDVERCALVSEQEDGWLCGTGCLLVRVGNGVVEPRFAYYQLCHPITRQWIVRHAVGATMPNLNTGIMGEVPFVVPPLHEQRAIADILGSLDDKIELNRRMNVTLEAMARALFKSWFVDFDPVRAKMDGRAPAGMDAATAALFPARLVDSELGPIPEGWRVESVYAIANVIYGAPFASSEFNSTRNGYPLIRIRDLVDQAPSVFTTEIHPKGRLITPGEIIVGMDGEFRAYLWGGPASYLNQRLCVFEPTAASCTAYVWNAISAPLARVEATETATTVIHLGKNDIDRFRVVVPDALVMKAYRGISEPILSRYVQNRSELRTLANVRDTLLPKLLSGELAVNGSR